MPRHDDDLPDGLLEALPPPVILLNASGGVLRFNSRAKALFPALRPQQHISAFVRDPGILAGVATARLESQFRQTVVCNARVPIERHLAVTIARIGDDTTGSAPASQALQRPAILLHVHDLTEQERLNRLRSDFIANASHELRTPLTAVMGFIETLQGPARSDPAARDRFLEIMARQAQRMTRLIDDLLSLSRIELREHLRPREAVDLNDIARQVLNMLELVAEKSGTTLHLQPYSEPALVLGDRDELMQVFANLVENAIKYGRHGGNVWLGLAREDTAQGAHYAVSVRDDGPGIGERHLPRLTERFYRAGDEGGEKSGTGLGLAIVKHTVVRHRGQLRIVSRKGEGATFTVVFAASHGE